MSIFKRFLLLFLCSIFTGYAQVGINTTNPDESAALHIESDSKGILIPQLDFVAKTSISNPATNLLIFDADEGNYEYNSGSSADPEWTRTLDESYSGARGAMNITATDYDNGPQTTFSSKGVSTRQKIEGNTTSSDLASFEASGNNRLVYVGMQTRYFRVSATVSFYSNSNNTILAFYVAKGNASSSTPAVLQDTKSYVRSTGTNDIVTVPVLGSV